MATSIRSGSFSNSSPGVGYSYDVFLSFRGEDTRKNFTDHLYNALVQAGIHTFRDDNELPRGEEICQQLLKAIEQSRISIVVFSKGYASSTWCLDELVKIMECKNIIRQIVLPLFYDIGPSDIRKQTGSFAEAFMMHVQRFKEEMEKVNKWRVALKEASNLSGYTLNDMTNGHESIFIQNIVEDLSNKLNRKYLHVAKHPVGIDSRVDDMRAWLKTRTNSAHIVGIHGMPGIGKTTVAKVVFNQLYNGFQGSCFLKNVAEKAQQPNGLVQLQEELLCEILKRDSWKINNEDRGINLIQERLNHKRVLVVLDDVQQQKQIDALVGDGNLFGVGSIIIITTRDENLLNRFEIVVKYQPELMNEEESLQLFSWHAFGNSCPPKDYVELSNKVVDFSGGLPLALEVLGSCLSKKDKLRWESVIEKLRKIPNHDIQKKLRISFDTLDDDKLQNTFLDIACFFIGKEKEYVAKVLEARCGFNLEDDLGTLMAKSLITVNCLGEINMHDLLRDMGREIIRKMSPDHPGKRNRIWHHEDGWNVLIKQMGTKVVEGLALDVRASNGKSLSTESFTKMTHLQLLKINSVDLIGCFNVLPKGLVWLCWHGCSLKSLPSNFELGNLVVLDMQYSNIRKLWKETKILNKLKIINLSYCKYLAKMPNFLGLSNLERLILKNCTSLVEVPESIRHLKVLLFLNLEGCRNLKILSESICDVKSLETLNISGCSQLKKWPERMGDMESLTELLVDGIENEQLLSSIAHLKFIRKLSLCGYSSNQDSPSSTSWVSPISSRGLNWKALLPTPLAGWRLMKELKLGYCGLTEGAANCVDFGSLTSLEELDLSGNKFFHLPSGIGQLSKLKDLLVEDCINLLSISELPSNLSFLSVNGCQNLMEIEGIKGVDNGFGFGISSDECYSLSRSFKRSLVEVSSNSDYGFEVSFLDGEIPNWFSYRGEGCSLSFHLPPFVQGLAFWIVFESTVIVNEWIYSRIIIKNKSNGIRLFETPWYAESKYVEGFTSSVSNVRISDMEIEKYYGEELELYVEIWKDKIGVKGLGVHMIMEKTDSFEESKSEWNDDIDNLQETTSSVDVEEGHEIDNQTGIDIMIPKLYHRLHHPFWGSITFSTKEQWITYLIKELPVWDIVAITKIVWIFYITSKITNVQ